jgi:hypothetical protein
MESSIFISKEARGKINCVFLYTVTSTVSPEKISSPKYIIMKVKTAKSTVWRKNINYLNQLSLE